VSISLFHLSGSLYVSGYLYRYISYLVVYFDPGCYDYHLRLQGTGGGGGTYYCFTLLYFPYVWLLHISNFNVIYMAGYTPPAYLIIYRLLVWRVIDVFTYLKPRLWGFLVCFVGGVSVQSPNWRHIAASTPAIVFHNPRSCGIQSCISSLISWDSQQRANGGSRRGLRGMWDCWAINPALHRSLGLLIFIRTSTQN
jgi:hypothetical protein